MESPTIQDHLSATITWFEQHVQSTRKVEGRVRELLHSSTPEEICVDMQMKIGRTCSELRGCSQDALRIISTLKTYFDRIGEVYELAAELEQEARER